MGRPPKQGIQFAGWDVDMFEDDKIVRLVSSQGWQGFAIFFFICQRTYGTDGYYYRWSKDSASTVAAYMGKGIRPGTVAATVKKCAEIGLFDWDRYAAGILTSRAIQERFVIATTRRRNRTVYEPYWLLEPGESDGITRIPLDTKTHDALATPDAETVTALPDERMNGRHKRKPGAETDSANVETLTARSSDGSPRDKGAMPDSPDAETATARQADTGKREAAFKAGKNARKGSDPLAAETVTALPDDKRLRDNNSGKGGSHSHEMMTDARLRDNNASSGGNYCNANSPDDGSYCNANSTKSGVIATQTPENDRLRDNNALSNRRHNLITQREREKERQTADCCFLVSENPFGDPDNEVEIRVDRLVYYARNNLICITENQEHELVSFRDTLPDELIIHCIDEACGMGRRTYFYAKSIMNRCVAEGITTVGEFELQKEKARRRRQKAATGPRTEGDVDEENFYG